MSSLRPLALSLLTLAAACGGRADFYQSPLSPLPAVSTESALVVVVPEANHALVLSPEDAATLTFEISPLARFVRAVPGSELVAVVGGTRTEPTLDLLDARTGEREVLPTLSAFDAIHFSPEGEIGLLTYATTTRVPGVAARNLNEVALLRMDTHALTRLQLDTGSLAPTGVLFGPDAIENRLVAVLFDKGVVVFDARHPERAARRITLRPQGALTDSVVREAAFSKSGRYLFLRASDLDDVVAVELEPTGAELTASLNFLTGGAGLSDLAAALGPGQEDAVLAVYSTSREAVLLDARGIDQDARRLALPEPIAAVTALANGRALFMDPRLLSVVAWDPATGKSGTVALDAGFNLSAVAPDGRAVLHHEHLRSSGGPALSIVSFDEDATRLRPHLAVLQLAGPAASLLLDPTGAKAFFPSAAESALVRLNLATLALDQVALDARPAALSWAGGGWLAAEHSQNAFGDLTLVPTEPFDASQTVRFQSYLLSGNLAQETP